MLLQPNADQVLQQGDIIEDVPFIVISKLLNVKATNIQGQTRLNAEEPASIDQVRQFSQGNALVAANLPMVLQLGMVVTQGCDIDHRDSITLARIFPLTTLVQEAKDAVEHEEPLVLHEVVRRLTEGHDSPHLIYLGSADGMVRYAADLLRVQSFPKEWKECFRQKRWRTLTRDGLLYVQARLSFHTGRFATQTGFWHTMPQDGDSAEKIAQDRHALDQARSRLTQKVASKRS